MNAVKLLESIYACAADPTEANFAAAQKNLDDSGVGDLQDALDMHKEARQSGAPFFEGAKIYWILRYKLESEYPSDSAWANGGYQRYWSQYCDRCVKAKAKNKEIIQSDQTAPVGHDWNDIGTAVAITVGLGLAALEVIL